MKKNLSLIVMLLLGSAVWGQVRPTEGGAFSQYYSKEFTEYRAKEFIINEILNVPNKEVIDFEINSLTASKVGELTTVIYDCKSLNKRGLVFVFWDDFVNDFNLHYKGYAFRNFDFDEAINFLEAIESVLDEKKNIINYYNDDLSKNAIYKWEDVTFVFYKNIGAANLIRVLWCGFDVEWNQTNLNTTKRRFERYFLSNK